jgi:hypothetical protein
LQYIPSETEEARKDQLLAIKGHADRINQKIVHRGAFAEKPEADEIVGVAGEVINGLLRHYLPEFVLQDKKLTGSP